MLIEPIDNLSFVGIYLLLVMSIAFNFVLGKRIRSVQSKVFDVEETTEKKVRILKERVDLIEESVEKLH
jgi:hypothetical protein